MLSTSMYLETGYFLEEDDPNLKRLDPDEKDKWTKKESPYQTWRNFLLVVPLMICVVTPRLLAMSLLCAICRTWSGFVIIMGSSVTCYAIIFVIYIERNI